MEYIKPLKIDYIATNVINEDYPLWSSTNSYNIGDRVKLNDKYYEATLANSAKNPEEFNTSISNEPKWSNPTVVNTKRCLDVTTMGRTTGVDEIWYTFDYGKYTSIAFLQTVASTLVIEIFEEGNDTPLETITDSFIEDYRSNYVKWKQGEYYFKDSVIIDMPFYPTADYIKVSVEGVGAISIGFMIFGDKSPLGDTQVDISRENRALNPTFSDDLGYVNIQENPTTFQYVDIDCFIEPSLRRVIIRNLQRIVGKVALFITTEIDSFNDLNFLAYIESATDTTKLAGFGDLNLSCKGYIDVNFY